MKIIKSIVALISILLIFNFGLLYYVHQDLMYYEYKAASEKVLYDAKASGLVQVQGDPNLNPKCNFSI